MTNLLTAIQKRHSVRAYRELPLDRDSVKVLKENIDRINREAGLNFQLVLDEPKAFSSPMAKYGRFRGVSNYLVLAAKLGEKNELNVGYYGEQLVLIAQSLGINSCWVGLTYGKVPSAYTINEGEKIHCVIALGYGETEGVQHKSKDIKDVSNVSDDTPEWFLSGVKAAQLCPTAVNQQKYKFIYIPSKDGGKPKVMAKKSISLIGYTNVDLGIAKCHFEIGAGVENFDWA